MKKLSVLVRSIHALPEFPTLINFLDGMDLFINQFKELQMFPYEVTSDVFDYYAEIQAHYPRQDMDLVASHNDLHAQNILYDSQKLWVIDWKQPFGMTGMPTLRSSPNHLFRETTKKMRF